MSNYIIYLGLHNEMNIFVTVRQLQRLDEAEKKTQTRQKVFNIARWMLVLSRSKAAIDFGDVKFTQAFNVSFQVKASRISFIFKISPKLLKVLYCMSK